jgi:hypothetical protein
LYHKFTSTSSGLEVHINLSTWRLRCEESFVDKTNYNRPLLKQLIIGAIMLGILTSFKWDKTSFFFYSNCLTSMHINLIFFYSNFKLPHIHAYRRTITQFISIKKKKCEPWTSHCHAFSRVPSICLKCRTINMYLKSVIIFSNMSFY